MLAGWRPSAEIVALELDRTHGWTVYERRYNPGEVTLGGNLDGIAGQTYDQYFVIVQMITTEVKTMCKGSTSWLQTCHWKVLTDAVCSSGAGVVSTLQAARVLRALLEIGKHQSSFAEPQHSPLLERLLRRRHALQAHAAAVVGSDLEVAVEAHLELTAALSLLADNVTCFAARMLDFYVEAARSTSRRQQQLACKGLQFICCDSSEIQQMAEICNSLAHTTAAAAGCEASDATRRNSQERLLKVGGLGALSSLLAIRAPDQLEIQCCVLCAARSLLCEHASFDAVQSLQLLASTVKIICNTEPPRPDGASAQRSSGIFSTREMMRRAAEAMRRGVVPTDQATKQLRRKQTMRLIEAAADVVEALVSNEGFQAQLDHLQTKGEGKCIDSTQLIDALTRHMHPLDSAFGSSLIHLCRAGLLSTAPADLASRALVLGEELIFGVNSAAADDSAVWRPSFTPQQQLSLAIEYLSAVSAVSPWARLQITAQLEPMWICCGQLMAILDRQAASSRSTFDKVAAQERLFPVLDVLRRAELIDAEHARDEDGAEPEPESQPAALGDHRMGGGSYCVSDDGSSIVADVLLPSLLFSGGGGSEETPSQAPELDLPQLQVPQGCIGPKMISFLETHRTALNFVLANDIDMLWDDDSGSNVGESASGTHPTWLRCRVVFRRCFDFLTKAHFLRAWLKRHKQALLQLTGESAADVKVNVKRDNLFEDAYCKVGQGLSAADLRNNFAVKFDGEEGDDLGGLTREWFELLAREIFDPNYALFSLGGDATYQPSSASGINQDHLSYFR